MRIRRGLLVSAVALLALAGCSPGGTSAPSPSPTPTASVQDGPATPTPASTPTAEPGPTAVGAWFLLAADGLIVVDDEGFAGDLLPFSDPRSVRAALEARYGAPVVEPAGEYCDFDIAYWFGSDLFFAADPAGTSSVVVAKTADLRIQPAAGPWFGQPAADFIARLPADEFDGQSYVYETSAEAAAAGRVATAIATIDAAGLVSGIAGPWPLGMLSICT